MDIAVLRNENERLKEQLARTQAALAESEEARQRLETLEQPMMKLRERTHFGFVFRLRQQHRHRDDTFRPESGIVEMHRQIG